MNGSWSLLDTARAAWPDFDIGDEELVRYAAARIPAGTALLESGFECFN